MDRIRVTFEQVAAALEAHAAVGRTIAYNDFADEVGLPRPNNLFKNSAVGAYFEQIDHEDSEEQRPFRTALVVLKSSGRPSTGFYKSLELHRGTKISPSSQATVWEKELAELVEYYKPTQPKAILRIELSQAQNTRLARLCGHSKCKSEALVQGTLGRLLSMLENDFAAIKEAEEQFARGQGYTSEGVRARIDEMFGKED